MVNTTKKDWSLRLSDALSFSCWIRTLSLLGYKTSLIFYLDKAKVCQFLQLNKLEEIQNDCAKHYKDRMKQ